MKFDEIDKTLSLNECYKRHQAFMKEYTTGHAQIPWLGEPYFADIIVRVFTGETLTPQKLEIFTGDIKKIFAEDHDGADMNFLWTVWGAVVDGCNKGECNVVVNDATRKLAALYAEHYYSMASVPEFMFFRQYFPEAADEMFQSAISEGSGVNKILLEAFRDKLDVISCRKLRLNNIKELLLVVEALGKDIQSVLGDIIANSSRFHFTYLDLDKSQLARAERDDFYNLLDRLPASCFPGVIRFFRNRLDKAYACSLMIGYSNIPVGLMDRFVTYLAIIESRFMIRPANNYYISEDASGRRLCKLLDFLNKKCIRKDMVKGIPTEKDLKLKIIGLLLMGDRGSKDLYNAALKGRKNLEQESIIEVA